MMAVLLMSIWFTLIPNHSGPWMASRPLWKLFNQQGQLIAVEPGPIWKPVAPQELITFTAAPPLDHSAAATLGKPTR